MKAKRVIAIINKQIIFNTKLIIGRYSNHLIHNQILFKDNYQTEIEKENYLYSFSYDKTDSNIKILETEFKDIVFPEELRIFEELPDLNLIYLFSIKTGKFKDFNCISISNNGLVKITNTTTNRYLEIKIGRFIKALIDDNKDFIKQHNLFNIECINTNTLEKITNKFKELLNNKHLSFQIVENNDILKGYTKDNYFIKNNSSSLAQSCMGDKLDLLTLYTNNSNVKLAIINMFDKIVARCLVWDTNKGKYYDKIYSNFHWVEPFLISELEKMGIKSTKNNSNFWVKLDYDPEYEYPYLDTFEYFDSYNMILYDSYSCTNWDKHLNETDGSWTSNYNDN
jgi:hypothetical protein